MALPTTPQPLDETERFNKIMAGYGTPMPLTETPSYKADLQDYASKQAIASQYNIEAEARKQQYAIEAEDRKIKNAEILQEQKKRIDKGSAADSIRNSALTVLGLLDQKRDGKISGAEADTLLGGAVGQGYKNVFEEAGKQFTSVEKGILSGANPLLSEYTGGAVGWLKERAFGYKPTGPTKLGDSDNDLRRKMLMAIEGANAIKEGRPADFTKIPETIGANKQLQTEEGGWATQAVKKGFEQRGKFNTAVIRNVKDITGGLFSLGKLAWSVSPTNPENTNLDKYGKNMQTAMGVAKQMPGAIGKDLLSLLDNPIKYAEEKPVDMALLFLGPVLGIMGKGTSVAGEVATGAKIADVGGIIAHEMATAAPEKAGLLVKMMNFLEGPGTKEFVAKSVSNPDAVAIGQAIMNRDVTSALTAEARIVKNAQALQTVGKELGNVIDSSVARLNGGVFTDWVNKYLSFHYPGQPELVGSIRAKLESFGKFSLDSIDKELSVGEIKGIADKLWSYGLQELKIGGSGALGGDMAKDLSRFLTQIVKKVEPASKALFSEYSALKEYEGMLPEMMKGVFNENLSMGSRIREALNIIRKPTEWALQKVYNAKKGIWDIKYPFTPTKADEFLNSLIDDVPSSSVPSNVPNLGSLQQLDKGPFIPNYQKYGKPPVLPASEIAAGPSTVVGTAAEGSQMLRATDEMVATIKEAIKSGDMEGAKALYKNFDESLYLMPKFDDLKTMTEIESAVSYADTLKGANEAMVASANWPVEYQGIINKFKKLLRIAGEKKNAASKELYREHIPVDVFGQGSDEVATDLGMSENDFMSKLQSELNLQTKGVIKNKK